MTEKNFNFGEKTKEKVKDGQTWVELEVWQSPKYLQSKQKAAELIKSEKYGLSESDFWILMNKGGNKMVYSGLILSHNGCLKINDKLPPQDKFKAESADIYKDENGSIVMRYVNSEQGIYEFGEISPANCKNAYPYAMVLKRLQDRVVLKTSRIAFFGILSEAESDEFKENIVPLEENQTSKKNASGLSKDGDLAKGTDMKETQQAANNKEANEFITEINKCPSVSELLKVRLANKSLTTRLFKHNKDLFDAVMKAKNEKLFALLKRDIEECGSLPEIQGLLESCQSDINDLANQSPILAGMLNECIDNMKLSLS